MAARGRLVRRERAPGIRLPPGDKVFDAGEVTLKRFCCQTRTHGVGGRTGSKAQRPSVHIIIIVSDSFRINGATEILAYLVSSSVPRCEN